MSNEAPFQHTGEDWGRGDTQHSLRVDIGIVSARSRDEQTRGHTGTEHQGHQLERRVWSALCQRQS